MRVEHEEAVQAAAKYREDLFNCKNELKEANEMVRRRKDSILIVKKEREHARAERDKARAELEKAHGELSENEKALANVVRRRNTLKVHVVGIGAIMAQAHEEAVQEFKVNFKDTDDYLNLMKDATMVYKESLKQLMLIIMTGSSLVNLKLLLPRIQSGSTNLTRSGHLGLQWAPPPSRKSPRPRNQLWP